MEMQQLKLLEQRVEDLIRLCARLDQEIRALKSSERQLRDEAMINRLRTME